ncbi:hypothetical protein ACRRTK_019316 [Alexandromys fortis]
MPDFLFPMQLVGDEGISKDRWPLAVLPQISLQNTVLRALGSPDSSHKSLASSGQTHPPAYGLLGANETNLFISEINGIRGFQKEGIDHFDSCCLMSLFVNDGNLLHCISQGPGQDWYPAWGRTVPEEDRPLTSRGLVRSGFKMKSHREAALSMQMEAECERDGPVFII